MNKLIFRLADRGPVWARSGPNGRLSLAPASSRGSSSLPPMKGLSRKPAKDLDGEKHDESDSEEDNV